MKVLKKHKFGKTFNVAFASIYIITKNQNVYHFRYVKSYWYIFHKQDQVLKKNKFEKIRDVSYEMYNIFHINAGEKPHIFIKIIITTNVYET